MGSSRINANNPLHDASYQLFADKLREYREQAELSQRDLAHLMGVPESYVGKCERRDRRVDPVEMIRWCKACEVDPHELLSFIQPKVRSRRKA